MGTRHVNIGPAVSNDLVRLAVEYNDTLDQCTRTREENIDEVCSFSPMTPCGSISAKSPAWARRPSE